MANQNPQVDYGENSAPQVEVVYGEKTIKVELRAKGEIQTWELPKGFGFELLMEMIKKWFPNAVFMEKKATRYGSR